MARWGYKDRIGAAERLGKAISLAAGLSVSVFGASAAHSQAAKVALVIANGDYGPGGVTECGSLGGGVAAALKAHGFEVEQVIDAPLTMMRSAIIRFAGQVAGEGKIAVAYICSHAVAADGRLFLLPVDVNRNAAYRLETQGVVVKAVVNTLAGTDGVLFADLDAFDPVAVQRSLPALAASDGVQMALAVSPNYSGAVGKDLLAQFSRPESDWASISTVLSNAKGQNNPMMTVVISPEPLANPAQTDGELLPQADPAPVPQARPETGQVAEPEVKAKGAGAIRKKKTKVTKFKKTKKPTPGLFGLFGERKRGS